MQDIKSLVETRIEMAEKHRKKDEEIKNEVEKLKKLGLSNNEIGENLTIAEATVLNYLLRFWYESLVCIFNKR